MVFPGCFGAVCLEEAFVLCYVLLFRGLVLQKETSFFRRVFWVFLTYGATEDKTIRWHHRLNGHEFEQIPGDYVGQGSLACCSPWTCRVGQNLVTEHA